MIRTLVGYFIVAVIGIVALKLVLGLIGFAASLFMSLLWFAAIGFVFYLVLKVVSPSAARRVRETIRGQPKEAD